MSTGSCNRQPLLIDRPLHQFVTLGSEACLSKATNFHELAPGGFKNLVDCSANDGALLDSIAILAPEAGITAVSVLVFLSTVSSAVQITPDNTVCVTSAVINSETIGERTLLKLPPLSTPVPAVGADAKNTGLFVPSGKCVFVGLSEVISDPTPASRVHVFAQGGFY